MDWNVFFTLILQFIILCSVISMFGSDIVKFIRALRKDKDDA